MKYALAALVALVIGSQADAQLIRRYNRAGYTPSSSYYYTSPSYYGTPYYNSGVVTSSYYTPGWGTNYVTPASGIYYSSPGISVGSGYWNSGYSNYYGGSYYGNRSWNNWNGGWNRRGYRW